MKLRTLAILAALALSVSIASAKEKAPVSTTISASADTVKAQIVARMIAHGYRIDSDGQFQMVFAKDMNGGDGVLTQLMVGNANCGMPKRIVNLTFAPQGDALLVVVSEQIDHATTLCTRERLEMDGKKDREEMSAFLSDIKAKSEAAQAALAKK